MEAPILVLFAIPPGAAPLAARAGLEIAAGDAVLLEGALVAYAAAARRARRPLPPLGVQLAIETGLGRDGLTPEEAVVAARRIAATPGAEVRGTWSHLQAPANPDLTDAQVMSFAAALAFLAAAGVDAGRRHLLATGGVLAVDRLVGGERPLFDGLRVGLATYGIAPDGVAGRCRGGRAPRRHCGPSSRSGLGRSASPTCRPAAGSATGRRS